MFFSTVQKPKQTHDYWHVSSQWPQQLLHSVWRWESHAHLLDPCTSAAATWPSPYSGHSLWQSSWPPQTHIVQTVSLRCRPRTPDWPDWPDCAHRTRLGCTCIRRHSWPGLGPCARSSWGGRCRVWPWWKDLDTLLCSPAGMHANQTETCTTLTLGRQTHTMCTLSDA